MPNADRFSNTKCKLIEKEVNTLLQTLLINLGWLAKKMEACFTGPVRNNAKTLP
jgi:hypothetical protein